MDISIMRAIIIYEIHNDKATYETNKENNNSRCQSEKSIRLITWIVIKQTLMISRMHNHNVMISEKLIQRL